MKDHPDQDYRTTDGEVVRRDDLDRAAGTPGKFRRADASLAGYDGGADLARAALSGDQVALDKFHDLFGLVLPGVAEHGEGYDIRIVMLEVDEEIAARSEVRGTPVHQRGEVRAVFLALNEGGHNSTSIDAAQLVAWILSTEGRAALARRGVVMDVQAREDEFLGDVEHECGVVPRFHRVNDDVARVVVTGVTSDGWIVNDVVFGDDHPRRDEGPRDEGVAAGVAISHVVHVVDDHDDDRIDGDDDGDDDDDASPEGSP